MDSLGVWIVSVHVNVTVYECVNDVIYSDNTSSEEHHEPRPIFRVDSSTTLMPGTPGTPPTPEQPSTESVTESTDPDTLNSVLDIVKVVLEVMSKR